MIYLQDEENLEILGKKPEQSHRSPHPKDSIDVEEVEEDTPDVLEVVEDNWEALDTKIDRSKARKHRRLKKNFARRSNDLPTTTGKKNEQSHRSPVQERLHGCNGGQEKTPGDTWRSQKTIGGRSGGRRNAIGGRKSIEKSSPGERFYNFWKKS